MLTDLEITRMLHACRAGDEAALQALTPLVYEELRRLASRQMRGEQQALTLQTSVLVNEAFLRLVGSRKVNWQNRAHFFAVSSQLMRRILVDFARERKAEKRGATAIMCRLAKSRTMLLPRRMWTRLLSTMRSRH